MVGCGLPLPSTDSYGLTDRVGPFSMEYYRVAFSDLRKYVSNLINWHYRRYSNQYSQNSISLKLKGGIQAQIPKSTRSSFKMTVMNGKQPHAGEAETTQPSARNVCVCVCVCVRVFADYLLLAGGHVDANWYKGTSASANSLSLSSFVGSPSPCPKS